MCPHGWAILPTGLIPAIIVPVTSLNNWFCSPDLQSYGRVWAGSSHTHTKQHGPGQTRVHWKQTHQQRCFLNSPSHFSNTAHSRKATFWYSSWTAATSLIWFPSYYKVKLVIYTHLLNWILTLLTGRTQMVCVKVHLSSSSALNTTCKLSSAGACYHLQMHLRRHHYLLHPLLAPGLLCGEQRGSPTCHQNSRGSLAHISRLPKTFRTYCNICEDSTHPRHHFITLVTSGTHNRAQYESTSRPQSSFYPEAVISMNTLYRTPNPTSPPV